MTGADAVGQLRHLDHIKAAFRRFAVRPVRGAGFSPELLLARVLLEILTVARHQFVYSGSGHFIEGMNFLFLLAGRQRLGPDAFPLKVLHDQRGRVVFSLL
jgi:hypothetical protein